MPTKVNNNRFAVVVCARHVVKRPSKRLRASIYSKRTKVLAQTLSEFMKYSIHRYSYYTVYRLKYNKFKICLMHSVIL